MANYPEWDLESSRPGARNVTVVISARHPCARRKLTAKGHGRTEQLAIRDAFTALQSTAIEAVAQCIRAGRHHH